MSSLPAPTATTSRRSKAIRVVIIVIAANLLLTAAIIVAMRLATGTVHHADAAETVAVTYTRAVLTRDYATWWDAVSPSCRVAPNAINKAQWIAEAKQLEAQTKRTTARADLVVTAESESGSGATRLVEVWATNPLNKLHDTFDVTVRQENGRWGVTKQTGPGLPPQPDCNVWDA